VEKGELKMALTIKHRDDGSFYEQGDTQGIIVPEDLPYAAIPYANTSCSNNTRLNLDSFTKESSFIAKSGTNQLVIKEAGLYLVDFGAVNRNSSSNIWYYINKNNNNYKASNYMGNNGLNQVTPICVLECEVNDVIDFQVYWVGTVTPLRDVIIVQLKRTSPFIIANKGALVSGGAFQFDVDGNGYTKNYSTNEIKIGTWIDGTDIYQKTFSLPSTLTTWDYQNASLPYPEQFPNNIIDYECILQSSSGTYTDIEISWTNWHDINFSYPTAIGGSFIWFYVTLRYKGKWF
jgi:hypothetical protein